LNSNVHPFPAPPPEPTGFVDTDIANATRLAQRHRCRPPLYRRRRLARLDGKRHREDPKGVRVQALAKDTSISIFDEIKTAPDRDAMMRHAKRSQSKAAVEAMILLARSEPGIPADITGLRCRSDALSTSRTRTIDLRTGGYGLTVAKIY